MATKVKKQRKLRKNDMLVGRKSGRVLVIIGTKAKGELLRLQDENGKVVERPNDPAAIRKSYYVEMA